MVFTSMLSSRAPSISGIANASASWASVSTSTSILSRLGDESLAEATAGAIPPAAAMWFSLTSIPSARFILWLKPPPQRTAYFSSTLRPGVVLRVSNIRAFVSETASTKSRVRLAVPDSLCSRFSATRSAISMPLHGPRTSNTLAPAPILSPSWASTSMFNVESAKRKTSAAMGRPAATMLDLATMCALAARSGTALVVQSPVPQSSSKNDSREAL